MLTPINGRLDSPAITAHRLAIVSGDDAEGVAARDAAALLMRPRATPLSPVELIKNTQVLATLADPDQRLAAMLEAANVGVSAEVADAKTPEIDIDDLFGGSPEVARMARWVAGEVVCGPDLPVLTMLAIFSAAIAVKAVGRCGGWVNPPNLFLAAEVASGENKSRVRKLCSAKMLTQYSGVRDWHAILEGAVGGRFEEASVEKKIKEDELKKLKRAGVVDVVRTRELGVEIFKLGKALKAKPAPSPGWLQVGKITSAQYMREMEIGGFVACFPDEGKETLWTFVGENGKGDIAPLLCGFTGEQYANATIGAEQRGDLHRFADYRATVWLPLQPSVLTPTTPEDNRMLSMLAGRGFLARFLISRPRAVTSAEAPVRSAAHAAAFAGVDVEGEVEGPYKKLLEALLSGQGDTAQEGDGIPERRAEEVEVDRPHPLAPARPWGFTYTPAAEAALLAYQVRTRNSAKKGGAYEDDMVSEFVSRLADHAHRLATLLAIMRHGRITGGGRVEQEDVDRAIRFLDGYALPHTLAVYSRAKMTPLEADAAAVLRVLGNHGGSMVRKDLQNALSGGGWGVGPGGKQGRLDDALEELQARGLLIVSKNYRSGTSPLISRVWGPAPAAQKAA